MGLGLDAYRKVGDKFPVEAYQWSFILCLAGLVIGAVAMYFTTDTKVVTKKAA